MIINPILLDIPHQFESSRLILRTPLDGDGKITFPAIQESIETLRHWFPTEQIPDSIQETEEILREIRADLLLRKTIHLLIFRQDTGDFLGEARLYDIDWSIPRASIGFWIRSSMQGQGYMTEAVTRITDISFDLFNLARLDLFVDEENVATRRVAEKTGYTLEGTLRHYHKRHDGELANTLIYAMIPTDLDN